MTPLFRGICLVLFVFARLLVSAQNSTNYAVTNSNTGSLSTDMNGDPISLASSPNLLQNSVTSSITALQPIGFDFYFMGKFYSHFVCNDDGAIGLGISTSPSSILYTNIANDLTRPVAFPYTSNTAPVLAPFWDNIRIPDTGPTVRKVTVGTAPNRCTVIDINVNINTNSLVTTATGQFQVRLYESTGVIEYVYGNMAIGTNSSVVTASIGFTAGTTDNSFLALKDLTSFGFTSLASQEPATENLVNTSTPGPIAGLNSPNEGSRRLFRFTPPALAGGPLSGLQTGGIGASCMTVAWVDNYTNEGGYNVFRSNDNINFALIATLPPNTISYTDYNLSNGTTYYWKVVAASEGVAGNAVTTSATTACGMSGVYSVGPGGHFPTIGNALDSLRIRGIAGNTMFELLPTYDVTPETFPITFPKNAALPCFSSDRRLTIRPAAGANLSMFKMISVPAFLLDSCDYVTIDGRVNSSGTTSNLLVYGMNNTPAIQLVNASHNKISYVSFQGAEDVVTPTTPGLINISGTRASGSDQNVIEGCTLSSYDVWSTKQILVYSSTNGSVLNDHDTVRNCNFYYFSKNALYMGTGTNGWSVSGNSFYSPSSMAYSSSVAALKVDYSDNTQDNVIEHNFFGGTEPNAEGSPMLIDYKSRFFFIEAVGKGQIKDNVFKRIKFSNTVPVVQPATGFINTIDPTRQYYGFISNNEFGGSNSADSINITFNGLSYCYFYCLNGGGFITGNRFSNIRSYSATSTGTVTLNMIGIGNAGYVKNNIVGDPKVANSIVNYTDAQTVGIYVLGPYSKVTDNQVCHLTARSIGSLSSAWGICVNSNGTDSIARNEIFQLNSYGGSGSTAALAGIIANSLTTGPNIAYQNHVYSLHYLGNNTASVVGIVGGGLRVSSNRIHSFSSSGAITSNVGISGGTWIDNNMIQLGLDSLGNTITLPLRLTGIAGGNLVTHNSIAITGNNVAPGDGVTGVTACILGVGGPNPNLIRNNIFYNDRTAATPGTVKNFCAYIGTATTTIGFCDYNVFYHPGADNFIAPLNTSGFPTLASWQAASPLDLHSVEGDPLFVRPKGNASEVDLHISAGSVAEGRGTTQYTTVLDADQQVRSNLSPVDIGADAGDYYGNPVGGNGNIDTTVCANEIPFQWNGLTIDSAGTYQSRKTGGGYDSIITLRVMVVNTFSSVRDTVVCTNQVPFSWNGITVDKAGNFTDTTKSSAGCDSIITLHVAVMGTVARLRDTTVCSNAVPFSWNGVSVGGAGSFSYRTKTVAGCDSVITLNVVLVRPVSASKDTAVCDRQVPFHWNAITVDKAGDYRFITKNQAGCDSTITLHVAVANTVTSSKDTTVCSDTVPFTWNGISITRAGNYLFTMKNMAGCDSTVTLHVMVGNLETVSKDTSICAGSTVHLGGPNVTGLNYSWTSDNGFTSVVADPVVNPVSTTHYFLQVTGACTHKDSVVVTVRSLLSPSVRISASDTAICAGSTITFTATAVNGGASPSYTWKQNNTTVGSNSPSFSSSTLADRDKIWVLMTSSESCLTSPTANSDTITQTVHPVIHPAVSISGNTVVKTGDTATIVATVSGGVRAPTYQWQDSTQDHGWQNISGATNATLFYIPKQTGDRLRVVLTSNVACTSPSRAESASLIFTVNLVTAINSPSTQLVQVFPNPAHSEIVINHMDANDQWQTAEIIDIGGASVTASINLQRQTSVRIPVQKLSAGTYILVLKNRKGLHHYVKFMKQ
jgi:hypothetical protein